MKGSHIYGSVDYGYGDPWSFHLHAALPGGHMRTFYEDYGQRKTDQMQSAIIKRALEQETFDDGKTPLMEGVQWIVYDPSMKNSRQEGGLAKSIIEVYQDKNPRVQFLPGSAPGRRAYRARTAGWKTSARWPIVCPDGAARRAATI